MFGKRGRPKQDTANQQQEIQPITIDYNPQIPALPRFPDKTMIDVRYMLISPYVSVHIYWNKAISEVVYELEEPLLNDAEKQYLEKIENGMKEMVNVNMLVEKSPDAIINYIDKTTKLLITELGMKINQNSYRKMFYYLYRDFIGLNEIEPVLRDYFVEDIESNGINTPLYIIHRVYRNLRTNITYKDMDKAVSFVEKLSQRCGRYISYASPLLDGSLPDGSRVNATYTTDVTSKGPTFTIRKFTKVPRTPIQLVSMN